MENQNDISDKILREFKERMKISHSSEDESLKRMLSSSLAALNHSCGIFDLDNAMGKELVFERARYTYNDSLEFFWDNFQTEILNLSINLMEQREQGGEKDAVI